MSLVEAEVPRASASAAQQQQQERQHDALSTREVRHEYARSLPPLLSQFGVSRLVSTYQAGKIVAANSKRQIVRQVPNWLSSGFHLDSNGNLIAGAVM